MSPRASPPLGNDSGASGYGLGINASNDVIVPHSAGTESAAQVKSLEQILNSLDQEKSKKDKNRRKSFINLLDL